MLSLEEHHKNLEILKNQSIPLTERLKMLFVDTSNWVKAGCRLSPEWLVTYRERICQVCEFWDHAGYAGIGKCHKCTCAMAAKIRMETAACPMGKW
jgi:hypothetical protein